MKKVFLIGVMASLCLTSCGVLTQTSTTSTMTTTTTTTTANAASQGQAAGVAIKNIYTQYKADGKFDTSNMNNIANAVSLVGNCQGLKNVAKDSEYWKGFAKGLVLGSDQLVTTGIADQVTSKLQSLVSEKTDSTNASKAASTAQDVASVASNISSIISLFK